MNGLTYVLKTHPEIDESRVAAVGHSYGGFMVNWFQSQKEASSRFTCFVVHAGMHDSFMNGYAKDLVGFAWFHFFGPPYLNSTTYIEWNPRRFVDQWRVPTLVVHGGNDFRIPITQGLRTFTSLQKLGIPSKFLYFPTEGHTIEDPNNSLLFYSTTLDWIDSWTL